MGKSFWVGGNSKKIQPLGSNSRDPYENEIILIKMG